METRAERRKQIFKLSLPAIFTLFGYNLIGLTDILMIGRLGSTALASTGIANFLFILLLSIPLGVSVGVQSGVARLIGQGKSNYKSAPLSAGVIIVIALSAPIIGVAWAALPMLFAVFSEEQSMIVSGVSYLNTRLPSLVLVACSACFRAFCISCNNSAKPILSLVVCFVVNLCLNYCLIFGNWGFPELGVTGAGVASTVAAFAGLVSYMVFSKGASIHYCFSFSQLTKPVFNSLLRLAIPQSINLFFVSLGILMMFIIVAQLGTEQLAVLNVLISFILVANIWVEGFGSSAITLVSRNIGEKRFLCANQFGWEVAQFGTAGVFAISLAFFFNAPAIVSVFIVEPEIAKQAIVPLQLLSIWLWLDAFGKLLSFSLIGAGNSKTVMKYTVVFWWLLGLPMQWYFTIHLAYGLNAFFAVPILVTALSCGTFSYCWAKMHR